MRKKEVAITSLVTIMLLVLAIMPDTKLAYLQTDRENNRGDDIKKQQFYRCVVLLESISCDPLHNRIFKQFDGTARLIYDPSKFMNNETDISRSISVEPRATSLPNVSNGKWQFIAVTWDGAILKLYRNGILEDVSQRIGSLIEAVPARLGSGEQESTRGNYWKGDMDETRIYSKVLTENEIIEIFAGSNNILDGVMGYWAFDGNTNDVSGNNNHGTYQGGKPEFVEGVAGKALRFDGRSAVNLPSTITFSTALSLTSWIRLDTEALDHSRVIFNNNQFFLRVDPQAEAPNRIAAFVKLIRDKPNPYGYAYGGLLASMAFAPDGRLFFTEKNTGSVRVMKDNQVIENPFVTIQNIYANGESGLLGLILDPNFNENHFVYLYYTYSDNEAGQIFNRVVRFIDDKNRGIDMKILLDRIPANDKGVHSGGALAFGPDEKLYITVGDALKPETAQNPIVLTGKVLRINRDGTIPTDNPLVWDGNSSTTYDNEVLDENVICESYNSLFCNFSVDIAADQTLIVEKDFALKQTGQTSIRFTINNPSGEVSFYRDYRKDIGGFLYDKERDWSQYNYLTFWINGSNDNSRLGVKIRDSDWVDRNEEYIVANNFTGWKSFMIPLRDTYPTMDFTAVRGIELVFHKGWNTSINLDALYLANSSDPFEERSHQNVSPVFTIGHRNMYGIAFDDQGIGIVTENGVNSYDEINKIERGGNYGWPTHQVPNKSPEFSRSSVKPLTSYLNIIAPAQVIFYDGDKIPELKGKFLFASYIMSNMHALHLARDNGRLMSDEIINANHTGPVISIAQSPDGYIYYGGSAIYRLEGVDLRPENQTQSVIEIVGDVNVEDLQLLRTERKMVFDITTDKSPSNVVIKIPKALLDGILSVDDEKQQYNFTLDDSTDYNIVDVRLSAQGNSLIVIHGTTVIPEFTLFTIVLTLPVFILGIILMSRKLAAKLA
jgi:glucose/arabinose dehydrogenase